MYLADVVDSVDEHLGEMYLYEVHRLIVRNFTHEQQTRFNAGIIDTDVDPEIFAGELMAKAAGKRLMPSSELCHKLPMFKSNLAELYRSFLLQHVAEPVGEDRNPVPTAGITIHLPDGSTETFDEQALQRATLWVRLSSDPEFIVLLVDAYLPFKEMTSFSDFRTEFLTTCLISRLTSIQGAKDVLKNFPARYKADHYH
jgi:hypothetical protein